MGISAFWLMSPGMIMFWHFSNCLLVLGIHLQKASYLAAILAMTRFAGVAPNTDLSQYVQHIFTM